MTNPQNNLIIATALQPGLQTSPNSPETQCSTTAPAPDCIPPEQIEPQPLALQNSVGTGSPPAVLQFGIAPLQSFQDRPAGKPRNGKIAHLPHLERDMVNRMLANNVPHTSIVEALYERGFQVTARNVSNWKTRGGYKEWRAAQEQALELRTFQDNLSEFLRRHDAAELSEVGLQSAATTISALLLRPDLMREIAADPQKYSKIIEMQCRIAREIQALQKDRDLAAKPLNPERIKRQEAHTVDGIRNIYSGEPDKSLNEPGTPHRNFIPRELDPLLPSLTRSPADTLKMMENLGYLRPKSASSSTTQPPSPQPSQPAASTSSTA